MVGVEGVPGEIVEVEDFRKKVRWGGGFEVG